MSYSNYLDSKKCCIKKTTERGPQGLQGEQGPAGPQGATGPQGAIQIIGVTGGTNSTGAFTPNYLHDGFIYPSSGGAQYNIGCDSSNPTYLPGGDWFNQSGTFRNGLPSPCDSFVFLEVDANLTNIGQSNSKKVFIPCYFKSN